MGSFHCPVGAATSGSPGCIRCGLCTAGTRAERIAAADRIREHIRMSAPVRSAEIRKIAVCGKGGTGKSTVTALLARSLLSFGYGVLVIDTDESNPSLHRMLGMSRSPLPLDRLLDRDTAPETGTEWLQTDPLAFGGIPEPFAVRAGRLTLVCAGKIEDPFSGCACAAAVLARELVMNLSTAPDEIVIADLEAGVESFGRGLEQGVDTVLAIVEPSMDSVLLAGKIRYMAEGLGIRRIRAVVNKVSDTALERRIAGMLSESGVRCLGALPAGRDIADASLSGCPVEEGPSLDRLRQLTEWLLDEADMDHPV